MHKTQIMAHSKWDIKSLNQSNSSCSLCARLHGSPLLGQIREALMEYSTSSNSKNLHLMV